MLVTRKPSCVQGLLVCSIPILWCVCLWYFMRLLQKMLPLPPISPPITILAEIINRKHPDCVWASQRDLLLSNQWTTSNSSTNLHIFLPFSSFLKSWGLFVLMEFKCNWHFTTFLYDVFFWREVDKIFLQWIKIIFLGFSLLSSKTDTNGKTMNKEIRLWK